MPCMVAASCAVPLAIWLRREAFLRHREPLLALKVRGFGAAAQLHGFQQAALRILWHSQC